MGPCNRAKTRSTSIPTQKTNPSITGRTQRTTEIHIGTPQTQNHSTIKESLHSIIFLHQKGRWKATTSTGLSASELMDYTEQIPPTSHSPTCRPITRMLTVHQVRHTMGVQQHLHQRRR